MKRKNRFYFSFHHRKKLFYVISSLVISSGLLFTGIFDIMVVCLLQNPNLSTHKFMKTVMVRTKALMVSRLLSQCEFQLSHSQILHAITFYLAFFGFVLSFESKSYVLSQIALTAGGMFRSVHRSHTIFRLLLIHIFF